MPYRCQFLIISQMGVTGSSVTGTLNNALPDIIARVREYASVPLAVGFGVATRDHFNIVSDAGADGVVIGSRLVNIISSAPPDQISKHVEAYCREISHKGEPPRVRSPVNGSSKPPPASASQRTSAPTSEVVLPARFGQFGGQYVPEALFDCLIELEEAHKAAISDPSFWKEFESFYGYMNRPSKLYYAESLTKNAGGAKIWLKREDLSATFSSFYGPPLTNMTFKEPHWLTQNQ
jgi:tryptophan synthase